MAKGHTVTISFDSDDAIAVNDLLTTIKSIAPYLVDNVRVEKTW